eukprot:6191118-Pleurochrysis_carterae.AAC.2
MTIRLIHARFELYAVSMQHGNLLSHQAIIHGEPKKGISTLLPEAVKEQANVRSHADKNNNFSCLLSACAFLHVHTAFCAACVWQSGTARLLFACFPKRYRPQREAS